MTCEKTKQNSFFTADLGSLALDSTVTLLRVYWRVSDNTDLLAGLIERHKCVELFPVLAFAEPNIVLVANSMLTKTTAE